MTRESLIAEANTCLYRTGHQPCRRPLQGENNGTFSITSVGGVASTFLLEWFKKLELARQTHHDCTRLAAQHAVGEPTAPCGCSALQIERPLHLVSCHVDDDGVFKHLADPRALNRFGRYHRAVYVVGEPIEAVASVFRRRFQCWHMYRLQNCWFSRAQRNGLIPCEQPGIVQFRERFGTATSRCRVPRTGPLQSLAAYAEQGEDIFGAVEQFRAWISCRAPRCNFNILVLRYEELNRCARRRVACSFRSYPGVATFPTDGVAISPTDGVGSRPSSSLVPTPVTGRSPKHPVSPLGAPYEHHVCDRDSQVASSTVRFSLLAAADARSLPAGLPLTPATPRQRDRRCSSAQAVSCLRRPVPVSQSDPRRGTAVAERVNVTRTRESHAQFAALNNFTVDDPRNHVHQPCMSTPSSRPCSCPSLMLG